MKFYNLFQRNGIHSIGYIRGTVTYQCILAKSRILRTHYPETHTIATGTTGIQSDRVDIESRTCIGSYRKFNITAIVHIDFILRPVITFNNVSLCFCLRIYQSIYPGSRITRFGITISIHLAKNLFCCQYRTGNNRLGILI